MTNMTTEEAHQPHVTAALKYMRDQMHNEDPELVLLKLQAFSLASFIICNCYATMFEENTKWIAV
jgi:hypothetical protein